MEVTLVELLVAAVVYFFVLSPLVSYFLSLFFKGSKYYEDI